MKTTTNKYNGILITLLLVFLLGPACRKTDSYYRQLTNTPELYTYTPLDYSRSHGATSQYHVGDTLRINGRFDATPSQLTVEIGGTNAPVMDLLKTDSITHQSGVSYYKTVETIRVVLTEAMGTGRLPVKVNCRGYTLNGPPLFLFPKGSLPAVTDTLVWRQLLSFRAYGGYGRPAPLDSFLSNPVFYPSYSGTGNIFFSRKSKIQLLHPDGGMELVADLQNASDARGPFSIVKMYNGAVDQQEHALYFSAATSDNYKSPETKGGAVDADSNWIFRFCKLDLQSKQLQVLNRTIFPIYKKNYNALGTPDQVRALYAGEGDVSQVKLPLFSAAWANNKGEVFFTPFWWYSNFVRFDNRTGRVEAYPYILSSNSPSDYLGKITPDGKVQYLLKSIGDWPGPGPATRYDDRNTILSFDPVKAIMFTVARSGDNKQISLYDLNSRNVPGQLFPKGKGSGLTGPFNLLDALFSPVSGVVTVYAHLGGENGRYLSLPGTPNRFLYDNYNVNVVYDFSASQVYDYAPLVMDSIRRPSGSSGISNDNTRNDLPSIMLNYDQGGHLYKLGLFYEESGTRNLYYDVRRTYMVRH